jgi:hypothetical protein
MFVDWHDNNSEQELEIVAGYNSINRGFLNEVLKETTAVHGPVKTLAVTMATQNARAHALFFIQNGFTRAADRSRNTWTYVCDLVEHRQRKKERKPRVLEVKETPKPAPIELKPMPVSEYQGLLERKAALDREIERLQAGL